MPDAPKTTDVDAVLAWLAPDPTTAVSGRAAHALVDALLIEGQTFLAEASTDDDVELFIDTYGYSNGRDPLVAATRIVQGLAARFPNEAPPVVARAAERARRALGS